MPRQKTKPLGNLGETLASEFLIKKGYKIIQRNFHSRYGEVDIIAISNGNLVFVEVKTRTNKNFGTPIEAVTKSKIEKIMATANYFSMLNQNLPKNLRIEVVSVDLSGEKPEISLIREV